MTLNLVDPGGVARPRLCRSCENNYSVYGCNFVKTVNIIDHKVGNWMIGMPGSASVSVAPVCGLAVRDHHYHLGNWTLQSDGSTPGLRERIYYRGPRVDQSDQHPESRAGQV